MGCKSAAHGVFFRVTKRFAQVTADPGILFNTSRQDYGSYVNKIRRCITTVNGHKPFRCCVRLGRLQEARR